MLNILFMGTPDFARDSLEAVYNAGHNILGVVTNPDRPKGRGMKLVASPVKEFAIEKNLKVFQPEKIKKNEEFISQIKDMNPDVICVVAYGKILPKEILDIPKLGCINVHGSLLPKYRGAAPIQWAVLNGDKKTGITTMYMDIGMDTGDMILKQEVEIGEDETTGELWDKLSKIGGELLVETLKQIENGTAPREKQGEDFSVATVAINGGQNAGILAAKILATSDAALLEKLEAYSEEMKDQVVEKDNRLQETGYQAY